ncbi:Subunit of the glycosylphosphatidylinositol transamidase complex-like protein [Coemansia sp. RSA 1822]|nr:Subunit of the glycosylphosphatidylinositol transamidase complex-like protein [Coemansia sp. RSA 638]KAJ2540535.1 Subunit of the glycosylphosphatidylinositol transamidase complex-like protein [Coemansia sp. RSA 1853]KAJ2560119.1 Subunit of the glycosylphosphatidylinositol transamidase complex-like protein [Coemansia sp. RSA 1822]
MHIPRLAVLAACGSFVVAAGTPSKAPAGTTAEMFSEDLTIAMLADGRVLLHFDFEMHGPQATNSSLHSYGLLPRQIGEIAQRYGVSELQLAFTQGTWREARWGVPPAAQGIGAEVIAQLADDADADAQWSGLTNALSGVFCASLNFVGTESTTSPRLAFAHTQRGGALRHGFLPRENVCTENLTPWIKQLPCQAQSGVAALLNPHRLFNMHFLSVALALNSDADTLRYRQTLSVVVDAPANDRSWALSALVGRALAAPCPVATRSSVRVVAPAAVQVAPPADSTHSAGTSVTHLFDLQRRRVDDIEFTFSAEFDVEPKDWATTNDTPVPAIAAHRHITGHGSSGGIETVIVNHRDALVTVAYFDAVPWYLRMYAHTLSVRATDANGHTAQLAPNQIMFTPAVDRGRPAVLELELELPPQSRTVLRYDFDKGFLKYSEHPPDANRGFTIAPAIVSYSLAPSDTARPLACTPGTVCAVRVYTEPALASLPTPDFSMPYNVITFTCTILALFFGRIFNLLTRDFAVLAPAK